MKNLVATLFLIFLFSEFTQAADNPGNPFGDRELGNPFGDRELGNPFGDRELGNPFGDRRLGDPLAHKQASSSRSSSPNGHKTLVDGGDVLYDKENEITDGSDVTYDKENELTWGDGHNDAVSGRELKSSTGSYARGYKTGIENKKNSQGAVGVDGEYYAPAGGGNLIKTSDGTFMQNTGGGGGYIDTKTGEFVPTL